MRCQKIFYQLSMLLFVMTYAACCPCDKNPKNVVENSEQNSVAFAITSSDPVDKKYYETLMADYLSASNPYKFWTKDPNDPAKSVPLKGFVFEAEHIKEIFDPAKNKTGRTAGSLVVYFGYDKAKNEWHAILMGREKGGPNAKLLNYDKNNPNDNTSRNISVFDKASPCPPCND